MAYIIDTYNKFDTWDKTHAIQKFTINDVWYAIYEVEMVWGLPMVRYCVDRDARTDTYFVYEKLEDAQSFVQQIKAIN